MKAAEPAVLPTESALLPQLLPAYPPSSDAISGQQQQPQPCPPTVGEVSVTSTPTGHDVEPQQAVPAAAGEQAIEHEQAPAPSDAAPLQPASPPAAAAQVQQQVSNHHHHHIFVYLDVVRRSSNEIQV